MSETNTTPQRSQDIDIAKGIGILLVVFGHNWIVSHQAGTLYQVIFSFHMPLFFFLSGVFLTPDRGWSQNIRQKADSLLKPYFVVLLVLAVYYMVPMRHFSPDYFIGLLFATGQSILWIPLWFLPNLFLAQLIAIMLLKLFPRTRENTGWLALMILVLLMIGIQTLHAGHDIRLLTLELLPGETRRTIGLPWGLDIVLLNTAFLLAGFLSARKVKEPAHLALPMLLGGGAVFALLHLLYDDTLNLNGRLYDSTLISSLAAFTGIYMTIGLSSLLSRTKRVANILAYLGSASLFIFIFHSYCQGKTSGSLLNAFPQYPNLAGWLGFIAGVVIPIAIFEVCRHSRLLSAAMLPSVRIPARHARASTAA